MLHYFFILSPVNFLHLSFVNLVRGKFEIRSEVLGKGSLTHVSSSIFNLAVDVSFLPYQARGSAV